MKETIFEQVASAASVLKLDLSAEEFALFAEDREFSEAGMEAVQMLLGYLSEKKQQTTIQTLLKMSRLPTKAPKTFENFDFSLLKGKDVERLKVLSSLNAIYSHRNLAFIGPAGTGKTHLAQAFGYACCQHGLKTYFITGRWTNICGNAALRAYPSIPIIRKNPLSMTSAKCSSMSVAKHFEGLAALSAVQRDGERQSRPGVKPFISALTVARCSAIFPGL